MQFHLNGYRPGDPSVSEAALEKAKRLPPKTLPDSVDVLIVGCGPTGLTLAAQLSAFPGFSTTIVDQRPGLLLTGQADGIACRTVEMFEAFGFSDRVLKEAYWVNETCFWAPDEKRPECIARSRVIQDVEEGLSEFPHVILNQARIQQFYLDVMRQGAAPIVPDYSRRLVDLKVDEALTADPSAYPLTAYFEGEEGEYAGRAEQVRARYIIGCDGARSAVRKLMGATLDGDSANQAWGVMDVLAITDFPDIRRKAAIHSATEGGIMVIPREGGYLIRLYIELEKLAAEQRVADLNTTSDHLIAAARRILHPYTLEVKEIAWWSVYEIGHRLCERYDDLPTNCSDARLPRVFIAGDACHTHSPKAGQGMNVSMQDSFNLGWKLASVLLGRASPALLRTYSEERKGVAQELITFDHKWSRMFSARPKQSGVVEQGFIDPRELQEHFIRQGRFTAGTATHYKPSLITGDAIHQTLARGFTVGMRFHSAPVIRLADAKPVQLGHRVRADGRWRLFVFADSRLPTDEASRLRAACEALERSVHSPVLRYTPTDGDVDDAIEVIAICQQPHRELSLHGMPPLLLPKKGRHGLIDYEKIYCPSTDPKQDIFDMRGIDRGQGCFVLVRPDQYVAQVLPLDAMSELCIFFSRFMQRTDS